MTNNIVLRHNVVKLIRRYLEDLHGFIEVLPSPFERGSAQFFWSYLVFVFHLGLLFVLD